MKFMLSISLSLLSFFSLQAQTFVESFLKNKDSLAVYHNGKGQEMIPVVRFYLFMMEDVELRSRMGLVYRYPKHCFDFLEPDLIVMPCMVCYAPEDATDSCPFEGLYKTEINNHSESKHFYSQERKMLCFDFCIEGNKWFLKGDTLYTGYVWDSLTNQVRLRTLQETLDDIQPAYAHYFNSIDSTSRIPTEKRQKIVRILDDEITYLDFLRWMMRVGFCGPSFNSGFYMDWIGYTPVFPKKAYEARGKENQ